MDNIVNKFRLASRELFNTYFLEYFLVNEDWEFYEHFTLIEEHLFFALVTKKAGIREVTYGLQQPEVLVIPKSESICGIPIMLNREIDSSYWDHSINTATPNCVFMFKRFFDWDQRSYIDNRYVLVVVKDWPEHPELVGKQALIEAHYVSYSKA